MRQLVYDGAGADSVVRSLVFRPVEGLHSIVPLPGFTNLAGVAAGVQVLHVPSRDLHISSKSL